jgi:hypothetical protein
MKDTLFFRRSLKVDQKGGLLQSEFIPYDQ